MSEWQMFGTIVGFAMITIALIATEATFIVLIRRMRDGSDKDKTWLVYIAVHIFVMFAVGLGLLDGSGFL